MWVLWPATLTAEFMLTGAFLWSVVLPQRRIWPPPSGRSWQFWFIWFFTIASLSGFFAVSFLDWNSFVFQHSLRFLVGGIAFAAGTALALCGVISLSFPTSAGLTGALVSSGPYRWSRNPQYFGSFGVLLGWALISNSRLAIIFAGLGVICFYLAALSEEPWLRESYGKEYEEYCKNSARFIKLDRTGPSAHS